MQISRDGPVTPYAFILQQYCNFGDLSKYMTMVQPRTLSLKEIYLFFKDITSGLAYLHSSNCLHQNLKPNKVLLHKETEETPIRALLSGFGDILIGKNTQSRLSDWKVQSIGDYAPELLRRDEFGRYGYYTAKCDMFGLGLILYFMRFGKLPYESVDVTRQKIISWSGFQDIPGERQEEPDLPEDIVHLLKRLLAVDPADRPTAEEVLAMLNTPSRLD